MFEQLLRSRQPEDPVPSSLLLPQPPATRPIAPVAAPRLPQPFQGFAWPWQQQEAPPSQPGRGLPEGVPAPGAVAASGSALEPADSAQRADIDAPGTGLSSTSAQVGGDSPTLPLRSQPALQRGDAARRGEGADAAARAADAESYSPQNTSPGAAARQQEDGFSKAGGTQGARSRDEPAPAAGGRPADTGLAGGSGRPGVAAPEPDQAMRAAPQRSADAGQGGENPKMLNEEASTDLTSQLLEASGLPLRLREDGLPEADAAVPVEERFTIGGLPSICLICGSEPPRLTVCALCDSVSSGIVDACQ